MSSIVSGLHVSIHAILEGSLHLSVSSRLTKPCGARVSSRSSRITVRAQRQGSTETETSRSRRAAIGLLAAGVVSGSFAQVVLAEEVKSIKIGPPPPPSGGLPGTLNSDLPRDFQLPYKERFYLQPLPPHEAAKRAKESAQDIVNVKKWIDKKAWPYIQNDLRLKAEYLRYDLNTVISAKPKDQKKELKELTGKLFEDINNLDRAAKNKSTPQAEKYYAETVSTLNDVLAQLG